MELWIRSQNKGALIKVEILGKTDGTIHSYSGINKIELGTYKSDERALEVLDEIQRTIAKNQGLISLMHNFTNLKGNEEGVAQIFKDMIYEMPKE